MEKSAFENGVEWRTLLSIMELSGEGRFYSSSGRRRLLIIKTLGGEGFISKWSLVEQGAFDDGYGLRRVLSTSDLGEKYCSSEQNWVDEGV